MLLCNHVYLAKRSIDQSGYDYDMQMFCIECNSLTFTICLLEFVSTRNMLIQNNDMEHVLSQV